jgi:hypothetical protein
MSTLFDGGLLYHIMVDTIPKRLTETLDLKETTEYGKNIVS